MKIRAPLVVALLVATTSIAHAFCLEPSVRVCAEFFRSGAVFVGTVTTVRQLPKNDISEGGWAYRLKVASMYRGPREKTIKVYTANDSDRRLLEKGHTYLLFAYRYEGRYWIGQCGNSGEVSESGPAIQEIQQILKNRKTASTGDIRGRVTVYSTGTDKSMLQGITMTIHGDRKTYTAVTDPDGWFHIEVPAGTYSVTPHSDKWNVRASDISWDDPSHFVVHRAGCAELQFVATPK